MIADNPAETMGALVRDTFRAMTDRIEAQLGPGDLCLSQWLALKLTRDGRIRTVGDIDRELGINSGAATRLADILENLGLVSRRRSETDRRVVGIRITRTGMDMIDAMQPRIVAFWRDQLSIFTAEERTQLFTLLGRLRDSLRRGGPDETVGTADIEPAFLAVSLGDVSLQ